MESDANVDVAERRIVEVDRCFLRTLNCRYSEVSDSEGVVGLLLLHQIRQYLYFCTSTASKLSTCSSTRFVTAM